MIAARVSDGHDLVEDLHLETTDFWAEHGHVDVGHMRYPGNPITFSDTPIAYRLPPPGFGGHNDAVCGGLVGLSEAELVDLQADGVIVDGLSTNLEEMVRAQQGNRADP